MVSKKNINPFKLAWERLKADNRTRVFINYPFEEKIIEANMDDFIKKIESIIDSEEYIPDIMDICEIPKYRYTIRPGSALSVEDRIVYHYCVGDCYKNIFNVLKPIMNIDFSYRLTGNYESIEWIKGSFTGWKEFDQKSIGLLKSSKFNYLLITDISGFYENIDIKTLIEDLKAIKCSDKTINIISKCLNKWAQCNFRGIPQGNSPSDILAKLYMLPIDAQLKNKGFLHLRYVDDIRIFCKSENDAKHALAFLSKILRKRGLCIQSSKTKILESEEAIQEIDGIKSILRQVLEDYEDELKTIILTHYAETYELDDKIKQNPEMAPSALFIAAYIEHISSNSNNFDSTLFHFLINRLGIFKEPYALLDLEKILKYRPEETEYLLKYIKAIDKVEDILPRLLKFIENQNDCIYPYQIYQMFYWIDKNFQGDNEILLNTVRNFYNNREMPSYLKSVCRKILGEKGNIGDLDSIEQEFFESKDSYIQAEIICCLKNVEKSRRNSFLGRAISNNDWHHYALNYIKNN